MKIQTKIALLFTGLCMLVLATLSLTVYYFANERAFQDFYVRLQLRAEIAGKARFNEGNPAYETVRNQHLQRLPEEREYIVPIDSLGSLTAHLPEKLPADFTATLLGTGSASYRSNYHFFRAIRWQEGAQAYIILITATHSFAQEFTHELKIVLIIANILALLVIFSLGLIFSNQILAPIRRITQNVKKISATSLHQRLETPRGRDEITELSETFNNMLARLETSFESQNNFVSNASHELNTPIALIMGESEYALSKPLDECNRQAFTTIHQQSERLRLITQSLLELAQSGFTDSLAFDRVSIHELLNQVLKIVRGIHPDCEISYQPPPRQMEVEGNFNLLELCIGNILNNACKYSSQKPVSLIVSQHGKELFILVRDQGIGIPSEDLPHIFDPFFRASNVKERKGYGIGLPLAQNIARLHKGRIDVRSRESEGTEVMLRLPL